MEIGIEEYNNYYIMRNSLEEFNSRFKMEERIGEAEDRPIKIRFEEQTE